MPGRAHSLELAALMPSVKPGRLLGEEVGRRPECPTEEQAEDQLASDITSCFASASFCFAVKLFVAAVADVSMTTSSMNAAAH